MTETHMMKHETAEDNAVLKEQLQDAHNTVHSMLDTIATTAGSVVDYGAGATCYPHEVRKALEEISSYAAVAMDDVATVEQLMEQMVECEEATA